MLNNTALVIAANALATEYDYISLHSSGPVTSSANETTAPRVLAGWAVSAAGVLSFTNKAFTGGAANGAVVRVGYWTAASGGTYGGGFLLSGDQTFNASGEYTVTSGTETPSSA